MGAEQLAFLLGCLFPSLGIFYADVRYRLVPDKLILSILLAGLVGSVYTDRLSDALLGTALGFGIFILPCLFNLAGGGDLKCAAALGAWLGPYGLARSLFAAVLLGAAWGVILKLRRGVLAAWAKTLLIGLYLRVICGVKGAVPVPKLPEHPDAPTPPDTVPFGACMVVAVWVLWGLNLFFVF
ncbi:leader peptidase (prepilin peptidase) / N-methyltransferase [Desulfofundulus australicus DSM 11792]|uniref:Leader peptidase (Prepilin peptidase) / N-methyltransferase n=1 Tax=Desulfofundulus australicus DSM 11792 TaxID=1121425 RepID=A0A1M4XWB8_9FIRM|nr:A24 family peptidase [Desulfofundulus australicus]SHE97583.1 leader peptidase (prepilin peptidase) / N-methyltransferase [Desulfofundulus australicus DSM 11792]